MNTDTTTLRTFSTLGDGDTFTWEPTDAATCTKVVYSDGRTFYRSTRGWGEHEVKEETGQPVYNVKTQEERNAEWDAKRAADLAKQREDAQAFRNRMGEVVESLGKGWSVIALTGEDADRNASVTLKGPKGITLWAHTGGYHAKGRIVISGELPRSDGHPGTQSGTRITVASDAHPTRIASHIVKRLLPEHAVKLDTANKERDEAQAFRDLTAATLAKLVKATKGTVSQSGTVYAGGQRMSVSGDRVRLELHLSSSVECMIELLAVLKKHGEN
jgi:hypothetical protein